MVNIAMARVVVDFVERTGAEHRPQNEAEMMEPVSGVLWPWLQRVVGGLIGQRAEVGPSV